MEIEVRNLIGVFTIVEGKISLLSSDNNLMIVNCDDNLDIVNEKYINKIVKINNLNLKQCYTFSEKNKNKLIISIQFIDIVNFSDIDINDSLKIIPISEIKNNNIYIQKAIEYLKKELVLNSTIKKLYPNEFALPEIQKIYEEILNKKYDRRNFRKRLIKLDVIEDLNKISTNKTGRPAKLYKFKDIVEDKILF